MPLVASNAALSTPAIAHRSGPMPIVVAVLRFNPSRCRENSRASGGGGGSAVREGDEEAEALAEELSVVAPEDRAEDGVAVPVLLGVAGAEAPVLGVVVIDGVAVGVPLLLGVIGGVTVALCEGPLLNEGVDVVLDVAFGEPGELGVPLEVWVFERVADTLLADAEDVIVALIVRVVLGVTDEVAFAVPVCERVPGAVAFALGVKLNDGDPLALTVSEEDPVKLGDGVPEGVTPVLSDADGVAEELSEDDVYAVAFVAFVVAFAEVTFENVGVGNTVAFEPTVAIEIEGVEDTDADALIEALKISDDEEVGVNVPEAVPEDVAVKLGVVVILGVAEEEPVGDWLQALFKMSATLMANRTRSFGRIIMSGPRYLSLRILERQSMHGCSFPAVRVIQFVAIARETLKKTGQQDSKMPLKL